MITKPQSKQKPKKTTLKKDNFNIDHNQEKQKPMSGILSIIQKDDQISKKTHFFIES